MAWAGLAPYVRPGSRTHASAWLLRPLGGDERCAAKGERCGWHQGKGQVALDARGAAGLWLRETHLVSNPTDLDE